MPNCFAVRAETTAISPSCSAVGLGLTAQSPKAHRRPRMTIKKIEETTDASGTVLMIWNDGLIVCAVVCAAPETMPSANPRCTIMVGRWHGLGCRAHDCTHD